MKLIHNKLLSKFLFGLLLGITFKVDSAIWDLVDELDAPEGFKISIYADGLESPRQITETNDGYIIVGSKNGKNVYALQDLDGDGYAENKILLAKDLQNPTGVVVYEGDLYFSEIDKIWRIADIDGWLMLNNFDKLPKKEVYMDDLPSETWHGYKYIDFGPDGNLYIPVGVPCNICLEPQTKDKRFAAIHKYVCLLYTSPSPRD